MLVCSAHHVGIAVHDSWLFHDVSVEIQSGERLAVVGPNGSGKTTLLKLLSRQLDPDTGTVASAKGARTGVLEQSPAYEGTVETVLREAFAELTMIEQSLRQLELMMATAESEKALERTLAAYAKVQDEFEQRGGYEMDSKLRAVVDGLGIASHLLQQDFSRLSGGEQTKIGFARLLLSQPDVLLLDEPTNHLDLASIEWLESYLLTYAGAVVVVSHDRYFLNRVATRVMELDNGEGTVYHGNYSQAMTLREERLLQEFQAYQEQQRKIEQMKAAIKRLRQWANQSSPPSAALHRRATNIQRALDRMEKLKRPQLERKQIGLSFQVQNRSGEDVVQLAKLSKRFESVTVLRDVSLHIRHGERVAIVGPNGSGKSTLVKLIMGQMPPDDGELRVGPSVRAGYLSQVGLEDDRRLTVLEAFREAARVDTGRARHLLAKFLFYGESVFTLVSNLSGGERMRLRLAQLMYQDINLLILDEPTNHLDIESRESLEGAIEDFPGTVIAVSHDRHFINLLFHRVLWLEDGGVTSYLGNYDEAREKRTSLTTATTVLNNRRNAPQ